jgi:hypothetical protein
MGRRERRLALARLRPGINDHSLMGAALQRAFDALNDAATDLTIAGVLAPRRNPLATESLILAEAVESEVAAVLAVLQRHVR